MSNFINNIEITNFKSIRHQKINGCKRINVFIGYPNVGKSNVLEALSSASIFELVNNKVQEVSLKDLMRLESYTELFFEGNTLERSIVRINRDKISFRYYKPNDIIYYDLHIPSNTKKDVTTHFELQFYRNLNVTETSLNDATYQIAQYQKQVKNESEKSMFGSQLFGFPRVLKYNYTANSNNSTDYYGGLRFPYGENLMQVLSENVELRKNVSELFERYDLKLALDKTSQSIKIIKENKDGTIFILPYSLIADTLQRLIFYQTAIYSNDNSVLLLEEPEAHMFPPYISKFTGDVWYKKTNQYFITTHSPFVINDFLENAKNDLAIYTVNLKDGETIINRLSEEQLHEAYQYGVDLFFNLESYLG